MPEFKTLLVSASFVLAIAISTTGWAAPVSIGFDGLPNGPFTSGPISEDGFTYSLFDGSLTGITSVGNPAPEMRATNGVSGNLSIVTDPGGSAFTFVGMDIAEFDAIGLFDSTLRVVGFFNGNLVGDEMFTPIQASGTGSYMSVSPVTSLLGTTLDELRIIFPFGGFGPGFANARVDNVILDNMMPPVPAPSAMLLFGTGLAGLVGWRWRQAKR